MKTLWSKPIHCAKVLFGLSLCCFFLFFRFQCETNLFPHTADRPGQLLTSSRHRGLGGWLGAGRTISFRGEFYFYLLVLVQVVQALYNWQEWANTFFFNKTPCQHLDGNKTDLCPFARWSHFQMALQLIKRVRGNMYYTTSASTLHVQRSHSQKAWALFH